MYKKFLENLTERTVSEKLNVTVYKRKFKYSDSTELVHFTLSTVNKEGEFKVYRGFVGTVGQITITSIDDKEFSAEEYITIN